MEYVFSDKRTIEILERSYDVVKAIMNPSRMTIINCILDNGNYINVTRLYEATGFEQSVCSLHLSVLRRHKIAYSVRDGKLRHYSVDKARLSLIIHSLNNLLQ